MLFGPQRGRQLKLGQDVRDGHIEDSTLIFHVEALNIPGRQVNFTLTSVGSHDRHGLRGHMWDLKLQKSRPEVMSWKRGDEKGRRIQAPELSSG